MCEFRLTCYPSCIQSMLSVYDAFDKWNLGCSACCHQVSRQFRSYIKADLQSLIYFTTTVPTVAASVAVLAVLQKSRLYSSKVPYIWTVQQLNYRRPWVQFQLQHQLQYPLSLTKLKTLLSLELERRLFLDLLHFSAATTPVSVTLLAVATKVETPAVSTSGSAKH
jgi:hypothetical protein